MFPHSYLTVLWLLPLINGKNVLILIADDAGLESPVYGNNLIQTPNIVKLASRGSVFTRDFTSVSSCSPSRSAILTGLPTHQNGMYGLHQGYHHFNSFSEVRSLPTILSRNGIRTGIIGKKHVGPSSVYRFDYEQTEENNSIMQVGRNITHIKNLAREFLSTVKEAEPFLLYIGFHDPHRCGHTHPQYGQFCEKFGNGEEGMGVIPDWIPVHYKEDDIDLPYFVQNTKPAKQDVMAQYTTISRLDQGIGLVMKELERSGKLEDTLVIYSSDNGIPFGGARTNAYDPGIVEPLIVSSPHARKSHGQRIDSMTTHLDITPTVLDWFDIPYPKYNLNTHPVSLTGQSLLPLLQGAWMNRSTIYISHTLHEATMYYPMRAVRTHRYKLIHNLNYQSPFPIDQDFYISNTFQDLLRRTIHNKTLHWYKTMDEYYHRPQWELYDLKFDPTEVNNLMNESNYRSIFEALRSDLLRWQSRTDDPWRCSPQGVLMDSGIYKNDPTCLPLFNNKKV